MTELVKIEIEVTPEVASALEADEARRRQIGDFVSRLVLPRIGADDPLLALFHETQRAAAAAGLGEAEIDAELAAYDAERRR